MLKDTRIGTRRFLLLGFFGVLIAAVGAAGLVGLQKTGDPLATVYLDRVVPLRQLKEVSDAYAVKIVDTTHKVNAKAMSFSEGERSVGDALRVVDRQWQAYLATYLVEEEKRIASELRPLMSAAAGGIGRLRGILQSQDDLQLQEFARKELDPAIALISLAAAWLRSASFLTSVVPAIGKTADLVREVAAASTEQASGVTQINRALSQVDQVTQRNASASEELASTAEEMASQAEALNQLMSFFRLNGFEGSRGTLGGAAAYHATTAHPAAPHGAQTPSVVHPPPLAHAPAAARRSPRIDGGLDRDLRHF